MKPLFVCLAVLASCIGSPLQATPTNNPPVANIQDQWTNSIVKWLEDVVNIPTTIPKLRWNTLAWDVINYSEDRYRPNNWVNFVMKDDFEVLLDKPMTQVNVEKYKINNMSYVESVKINEKNRDQFKGNLSNAIGQTMGQWSDEYVQKLQQKQTEIEAFIKLLEGVQAQLVSTNDAAIKNESTMKAVQDFLDHQVAITWHGLPRVDLRLALPLAQEPALPACESVRCL